MTWPTEILVHCSTSHFSLCCRLLVLLGEDPSSDFLQSTQKQGNIRILYQNTSINNASITTMNPRDTNSTSGLDHASTSRTGGPQSVCQDEEMNTPARANLASKLVGDISIAAGVTFGIAPLLAIVDKAIVESANGSKTLVRSGLESVRGIVQHPIHYLKSPTFLLMWGVYAATYGTANSLKTITEHYEGRRSMTPSPSDERASAQTASDVSKMTVFLGTTFANSSSALLKDQAYAKMFGSNSTALSVPRLSYACWIARDFSVIGSSFILPDLVSGHVARIWDMDERRAKSASQVALPVLSQFIAGPLHLLGLDLYNRNLSEKTTWRDAAVDRSKTLYRGFVPVVVARIARIIPGYSIGGVLNTNLRDGWREHLVQSNVQGSHSALSVAVDNCSGLPSSMTSPYGGNRVFVALR